LKVFVLSFAVFTGAARVAGHRPDEATSAVRVPLTAALPDLDGELDEAVWQTGSVRSGAFTERGGTAARPFSEARVAWTRTHLLLGLYAADEDIRTSGRTRDAFRVSIGQTTFEVSATGELRGAPAGTRVGQDHDGTLDEASDDDEEWVIELAVPWGAVDLRGEAGERVDVRVERCDTPRGAARACGSTGRLALVLAETP
jgi:hypothetical protein